LAIVLVGSDPSAHAYRDSIARAAAVVEMPCETHSLPANCTMVDLLAIVETLNHRDDIHGFLVLQPLPPHLSRVEVADAIDPTKDIDGITTFNAGRLFHDDRDVLAPSTPAGAMALLKYYDAHLAGAHAVVVGRSPVVGKPMAALLLAADCTVTTCHSRTRDLPSYTLQADLLIAAVGRPRTITGDMVKPGATVVDFGINFVGDAMVGDIDAESVMPVAGRLTPVPGGTGRVTTMVLIRNVIKAGAIGFQRRGLAGRSDILLATGE